jgi:UDP-N-acetyl-2-amino-2-deoxyglucuronate dehydrogenase
VSQPDDRLRVAIVGPGKVAATHARAVAASPDGELVAVVGRTPERAQALADAFGARAFRSVAEAAETTRPDVAIVCTPHPQHVAAALDAFAAGMHVLVEKPLSVDPAEARRMIDGAAAAGRQLSVVSQRRWYEPVRRMKAAIDEGQIGDPVLGTVTVLGWRGREYYAMDAWRGTWAGEGGGVLVNQAVHQLDLLLWFMGRVEAVTGFWANLNHPTIQVEDTAVASLRFAGGALGSIVVSNAQDPGLYARVHVHGRNGATVGVQTDGGSSFVAGMESEIEPAINDLWTIPGDAGRLPGWQGEDRAAAARVDIAEHYHALQVADFLAGIREDRPPAVSGADGLAVAELIAAIYQAGASGGSVSVRR